MREDLIEYYYTFSFRLLKYRMLTKEIHPFLIKIEKIWYECDLNLFIIYTNKILNFSIVKNCIIEFRH